MYVNIYIYMNLHVRLQYMYMHIRIHMQIHIQRKSKASPCTYTYVLQKHVHVQKHMQTHLQRLLHIHIYIHKHIHSLERSQHQPSIRVEWVLFILVSCPSRTSKVTWESLQTCHDRSDPQYCRLIPWSLMIRLVSEKGLGSPKKIPPRLITRHFILTQARQQWQTQQAWEVTVSDVCGSCWMALRYLDYVERVCWICWIMVTNTLIVTDSWCPFSVGYSSEVSLQRCFSSFADGQRPPTSALWCTQDLCFLIMHVLRTSSVCVFLACEKLIPKRQVTGLRSS